MRRALLVLVLLAGLVGTARAGNLYVATTGSDSAACSLAAPCQTIAHVQTVAQGLIASGLTQPLYIWVHAGTYQQSTGLTFGAADSGTSSFPVYWLGFPGEPAPVISGGAPVTGWTLDTGSIYRSYVGTSWNFRQLYVNGVHAQRARGPSNPTGWTRTAGGYTPPDSSMETWGNPTDVEFVSFGNWVLDRGKAAALSGSNSVTSTVNIWTNTIPQPNIDISLAMELGTQFTADVSGQVTGLRFYRMQTAPDTGTPAPDTGTHDGHLWDSVGNLLATATFPAWSGTGWQDASLSTPVNILADTIYVVSYTTTAAVITTSFWGPTINNPPLHAPTTNGVFSDTPGTYPGTVHPDGNNYWTDVDFAYSVSTDGGVVTSTIVMSTPFWTNQSAVLAGFNIQSTPGWVENAYELMASGYWYLNRTTGYLYYWPPSGTMAGVTVTAPVVDPLLTVSGASNIQFGTPQNPLVLAFSNWTGPDSTTGYVGLQSGYTYGAITSVTQAPDAGVIINASNGITFNGDQFSHLGSHGILVKGGSSHISIVNNRFDDIAGGPIQIGDVGTCPNGCVGFSQENVIAVEGNIISSGNEFDYFDAGAIFAPAAAGSMIANNTIAKTAAMGIAIGWGWGATSFASNNIISNNSITNSCGPFPYNGTSYPFSDCGAIYTNGAQSSIGTIASGLTISGNHINGTHYGIYHDNGTAYFTDTNDVILNSDSWLALNVGGGLETSTYVGCSGNNPSYLGFQSPIGIGCGVWGACCSWSDYGWSWAPLAPQPFGTPAQAIICGAGVPGSTACTTPTLWPTWQSGVGATWSRPQIGP